jgi:proline dehydrogenase
VSGRTAIIVGPMPRSASLSRRVLFALATSERFERTVRGLPGVERRARRYVAGTTADDALAVARGLGAEGLSCSIDLFGERVRDGARADAVVEGYLGLVGRLNEAPPGTFVSLDLSHLALEVSVEACLARVRRIAAALPDGAELQVGAEEERLAAPAQEIVIALSAERLPVWTTLQANLRRSPADADRLIAAGVAIRLVKGAYVESPAVALPYGPQTDAAFRALAGRLQAADARFALATHDPAMLDAAPGAHIEMLRGVREGDARALARAGRAVRIYVPYGDEWFRYAMRRAAEARGAG